MPVHPAFRLRGKAVTRSELPSRIEAMRDEGGFSADLADFMREWLDAKDWVHGQTSGSTGTPKQLKLSKKAMAESAARTCAFLGLNEGDTAYLCMPVKYVGGKMMVVRAMTQGLDLIWNTPSLTPMKGLREPPVFTAMTPMQATAALADPDERELLKGTRHILLGGSAVSPTLAVAVADFPNAVWSTYGMTETVSHIALRRLSGEKAAESYMPLPGVTVSLAENGALTIDAPGIAAGRLVTNDLAEILADGSFRILGRLDNVINTGGIKVQIETAETLLRDIINAPIAVTSVPDEKTAEKVVLLVAGSFDEKGLMEAAKAKLPRYWNPKVIVRVDEIPETGSGKPDRRAIRALAARLLA